MKKYTIEQVKYSKYRMPKLLAIIRSRSSFVHASTSLLYSSILLTFLLAGCAGDPQSSTQLSGRLTISGSTALQPLVTAAAKDYMQEHPNVKIEVSGGGSQTGLQNVTSNKSTIGDSDIYADPAIYPDPNLTDHIVCVTPFVMIVNPDVTLPSLTKQQIIDIFSTGKYHNWNELGGPNLPIATIVRPSTSGTRATFRKYILGGRDEIGTFTLSVDSTQQVVNMVASKPGSIGYAGLSAVTPRVKAIGIDGITANATTIRTGRYNFWSYEHMFTLGIDNTLANDFIDFISTDSSMKQLEQNMHYIPDAEMNLSSIGTGTRPTSPLDISSTSRSLSFSGKQGHGS
jgi:phosphate transport system substrate-binding protein